MNPAAAYCNWNPTRDADPRDFVAKLSYFVDDVNIGLMDDTCDGFIRCSAAGRTAVARIAVTPPHLSPGTRHLISVADGLKDREERDDSLYPADHGEADAIALDLLERVFETVQGVNLDAMANLLEKNINPDVAIETSRPWFRNASGLFDPAKYGRDAIEKFPLLKAGERRHRRFISLPALKLHLRERPDLLAEILRPPASDEKFFDSKMPPMQRGSDARPLHLTRRQYVFLRMWAKRVAEGA